MMVFFMHINDVRKCDFHQ